MKDPTVLPEPPRPRDAKPPRDARPAPEATSAEDPANRVAELKKRQRQFREESEQLRRRIWGDLVAQGKTLRAQITDPDLSFDLAAFVAACGFSAAPHEPKKKAPGPNTLEGWIGNYRATAIRHYLRKHADLVEELTAKGVPEGDYQQHIPAEALKEIDDLARAKAKKKMAQCSAPSPATKG